MQDVGQKKITDIFTQGRSLEIPFFQRGYVWDDENWKRFLEDMDTVSSENSPYFMGSLILKQRNTETTEDIGDVRSLVDGQQRLTTIILFFKVAFAAHGESHQFDKIFYNIEDQISLRHNHNDIEIFESIVEGKLDTRLEDKHAANKILKCYKFFKDNEESIKNIDPKIIRKNLYFVVIDLRPDEDEQQIFDTINSLGVDLTIAELLKNELFRREDEELFDSTWRKAFEGENKEFWDTKVTTGRLQRQNIDMLLQAYLLICSQADEKYTKRLDSLFMSYKNFIRDQSIEKNTGKRENFIRSLMNYAEIYQKNINSDLLSEDIDKDSVVERMNLVVFGLNTTTVIPYLVYVLKEADTDNRDGIFSLLESYIVRRAVCKETNRHYNNMFASFIRKDIKSYDDLREEIFRAGEDQVRAFPDNESFKKGFESSTLINQQAKTILYLIEKGLRDDKHETVALLGLNKYSLEHVMPKKWRKHWQDGLDERQEIERNRILLKLGNLTIITSALNTSIRNSGWETKKQGAGKKKGLCEYSKSIKIFERFLKEPEWNEEKIRERGAFLFNAAKDIWPYIGN